MTITNDPDWQPGDRLYASRSQYRVGLYGFRDDTESETCGPCPDAATWPTVQGHARYMPDGDEIGDLIELVRADRAAAEQEGLTA